MKLLDRNLHYFWTKNNLLSRPWTVAGILNKKKYSKALFCTPLCEPPKAIQMPSLILSKPFSFRDRLCSISHCLSSIFWHSMNLVPALVSFQPSKTDIFRGSLVRVRTASRRASSSTGLQFCSTSVLSGTVANDRIILPKSEYLASATSHNETYCWNAGWGTVGQ